MTYAVTSVSPSLGGPGDWILVFGTDLNGTTSVSFGGVSASGGDLAGPTTLLSTLGYTNETVLLVKVPDGAKSGPLLLDDGVEQVESPSSFIVASNPLSVPPFGEAAYGVGWAPIVGDTVDVSESLLRVRLSASAYGHNQIRLAWDEPRDEYERLVITRSSTGHPVHPFEGAVVFSGTRYTIVERAAVDAPLGDGRFYYYSMFLEIPAASVRWQRVAVADDIVPYRHGGAEMLMDLLPHHYLVDDASTKQAGGDLSMEQMGTLERFLRLIGWETDYARSLTDHVGDVWRPSQLRSRMLTAAALSYGVPREYALGDRTTRRLLRHWIRLQRSKGTLAAARLLAGDVTGYTASVYEGRNLIFGPNGSEFKVADPDATTSVYWNWKSASALALARVTTPAPPVSTPAALRVEYPNTSAFSIGYGDAADVRKTCMKTNPVGANVFSAYVRSASTTRSVTPKIHWYDAAGDFLETTTGTPGDSVSGSWTRLAVADDVPTDAVYARPELAWPAGAANEQHFIAAAQFEAARTGETDPTDYQAGRTAVCSLRPDRINLCKNPSFETNTNHWSVVATASGVSRNTTWFRQAGPGAASMRISNLDSAPVVVKYVHDEVDDIIPGSVYTAGAYLANSVGLGAMDEVRAYLSFVWLDVDDEEIDRTDGPLLAVPRRSTGVDFTPFPATVSSVAPDGAVTMELHITWVGYDYDPPATNYNFTATSLYVDDVILEREGDPSSYFDGSLDPTSDDYYWEGTTHLSRSYYYPGRPARQARLEALLPEYLPADIPFTITFGG